ncbi:MAG: 2-oxoacid:acceptor oxidoreductase family protein, partial [Muribaculaceae bacterium]|nr:2-oxoacid:acceptor oxidoreductase family protein [Muribaculaceae bacterium]
MKTDIVLAGVGGQGILSIATILGSAALKENLYVKQAEVHGMSQRGGDVQSNLRLSSDPIASDLIPQ